MASRDLGDLNQATRLLASEHIRLCAAKGIQLLVYCTLRSNEEQDMLYALGRTKPGKIVTFARAGQSAHNPGKDGKASAYDCVGLLGGKPQWADASPLWAVIGACGEEAGLSWSGRWQGSIREKPHLQHPAWKKTVVQRSKTQGELNA